MRGRCCLRATNQVEVRYARGEENKGIVQSCRAAGRWWGVRRTSYMAVSRMSQNADTVAEHIVT